MRSVRGIALASAAALAFAITASAHAADGTFDKTLHVNGTVQLSVSTGSGNIHLAPGPDDQVHIVGHVHSTSSWMGGGGQDAVDKVVANPPIEQNGGIVRIGKHNGDDALRHVSIDYDITTPKNTQVKADTGSGDVRAHDLSGGAKLETGSGNIEAQSLSGDTYLQTGSGDIRASFGGNATVNAGTGSGNIKLSDVRGGLKAETGSGDVTASGQPTETWKVETGSGNIDLTLGGAKYSLDAETSSGSIHSDQPVSMQGGLSGHHVTGNVNGGGPTVKIETGSGDIRIH